MLSLEGMDYKGDFTYVAKGELYTKQVIEIPVIPGYQGKEVPKAPSFKLRQGLVN